MLRAGCFLGRLRTVLNMQARGHEMLGSCMPCGYAALSYVGLCMLVLREHIFMVVDVLVCAFHAFWLGSVPTFGIRVEKPLEGIHVNDPCRFRSFPGSSAMRTSLLLLGHPLTRNSRLKAAKELGGGHTRTLGPGIETGRRHRHPHVKRCQPQWRFR